MIVIGLLVWVGIRLGAQAAFYILLGIDAVIKILVFSFAIVAALVIGVKLGEKK